MEARANARGTAVNGEAAAAFPMGESEPRASVSRHEQCRGIGCELSRKRGVVVRVAQSRP
jgi:hypothetical protein